MYCSWVWICPNIYVDYCAVSPLPYFPYLPAWHYNPYHSSHLPLLLCSSGQIHQRFTPAFLPLVSMRMCRSHSHFYTPQHMDLPIVVIFLPSILYLLPQSFMNDGPTFLAFPSWRKVRYLKWQIWFTASASDPPPGTETCQALLHFSPLFC